MAHPACVCSPQRAPRHAPRECEEEPCPGPTSRTSSTPCAPSWPNCVDVDGDYQDSFYFAQTLGSPVTNEYVYAALGNTELFEVVTAGNHTVTVEMSAGGTADVVGDAKLTLVYVPFDWQGNAATGFTPAATEARQPERP